MRAALLSAAVLTAAAALHGASPTTADPDAYYHLRHAWVYATQGVFDSSFPWARFSAIRDQASDLWYGLHVLLVPFARLQSPLDGLLAASVAVTAAALGLLLAAFTLLRVPWPVAWLIAFAASGDVLFRLTMLRPQPLSLGLAVLALALMASQPRRRRPALLFALALAAAWVHLALAWLVPLVVTAFAAVSLAHRRRPDLAGLVAVAAGTLAGFALRPNPIGALRLSWIQIGLFLEVKARGLALPFGQELQPLSFSNDGPRLVLPLVGLLAAAGLLAALARRGPAADAPARVGAWTALALSLLFGVLSVRVANRSIELAAAFGAVAAALVFREHRESAGAAERRGAVALLALLLAVMAPVAGARYLARVQEARPLLALRGASLWLAANGRPGELVFHAWWDQFPHLFFWNPRNHYVGGMDPLFQLAHDESLFWKAYWLSTDAYPQATCGRSACEQEHLEPTPLVLRRDFGAAWVVVHRHLNPRLDAYLASDPAFRIAFDDGTDAVYRVQYDAAPLPGGAR